ncbi:CvpA family protein [Daejeonella sp. JGW-45]|uniref:CvpA family protein n=1 Tax=Daejeonella sp. JGW-45 TaxID=3034148 RepID=UPI0023EC8F2D|nr:CvpA family protein [Daejeonella sp. JGW-45]
MFDSLNIADIILILIMGLTVYSAFRKGFIESLTELSTWLGSFLVAFFLSDQIVRLLHQFNITGFWIRPVFFIILLILTSRMILISWDRLSAYIPGDAHYHWSNKVAGILPGLVSGVVYASLVSFFLSAYPLGNLTQRTKDSKLAGLLNNPEKWPGKPIADMASDLGYMAQRNITVRTKGNEMVTLPFKTDRFQPRPDLEIRMLQLINNERKKKGLQPMVFDKKLAGVALKHSADMLQRGYFSHYNPEAKSPFDRMRAGRVSFTVAGENLALAQTLQSAHEGLMESPTHRANILSASFGRAGISILDTGIHGIIVTQNFRN